MNYKPIKWQIEGMDLYIQKGNKSFVILDNFGNIYDKATKTFSFCRSELVDYKFDAIEEALEEVKHIVEIIEDETYHELEYDLTHGKNHITIDMAKANICPIVVNNIIQRLTNAFGQDKVNERITIKNEVENE